MSLLSYFIYQQDLTEGSDKLKLNNNVCATTNINNVEQQQVICLLLYGFLLFIFKVLHYCNASIIQ